jgi:AcrR family transcriptional regulator
LELFTTQGYHGSTTPQIAARACIAEGTIYRHFESKAHLLNEIYRAGSRKVTSVVEQVPAGLSARERLRSVAAEWRMLAHQNPPLMRFMFSADLRQHLDHKSLDAFRRFRNELEKVVAQGKASGEVRAGSVELWTDVWLRLVILMLERTAAHEWPLNHPAADLVLDAAWAAISLPGR